MLIRLWEGERIFAIFIVIVTVIIIDTVIIIIIIICKIAAPTISIITVIPITDIVIYTKIATTVNFALTAATTFESKDEETIRFRFLRS